jgi:hypothetical protein
MSASFAAVAGLAFLLAPEGRMACGEPWLDTTSPDRAWTLRVCRRPMLFAMPGGSSDAPGWIVLRDSVGAIRGIVHLDMMQLLSEVEGDPVWEGGQIVLPGLAALPLAPAAGPVTRWLADRLWRLRALTGLVPSDEISAQWAWW